MRNSGDARRRTVLARQRPRPLHVRSRPRTTAAERGRGTFEWLSAWGTFVSAVAAAVGLIFAGLASWVSVATLNDQRADDESDRKREMAAQASRVAMWSDEYLDQHGKYRSVLHIMNRSPAPIVRWSLETAHASSPLPIGRDFPSDSLTAIGNIIPPCTELTLDLRQNNEHFPAEAKVKGKYVLVTAMRFQDSYGQEWVRERHGALGKGPLLPRSFGAQSGANALPWHTKKLPNCSLAAS